MDQDRQYSYFHFDSTDNPYILQLTILISGLLSLQHGGQALKDIVE